MTHAIMGGNGSMVKKHFLSGFLESRKNELESIRRKREKRKKV
jgi:hypothetical protein